LLQGGKKKFSRTSTSKAFSFHTETEIETGLKISLKCRAVIVEIVDVKAFYIVIHEIVIKLCKNGI